MDLNKLSDSSLKRLDRRTIGKMAEDALQHKDYVSLKRLVKLAEPYVVREILEDIYETLQIEALDKIKDVLKDKIDDIDLSNIVDERDHMNFGVPKGMILDREWIRNEISKFLLTLLEIKSDISAGEIEKLSYFVEKDTFYKFIDSKNISVKDNKFAGLRLEHYELEDKKPLLEGATQNMSVVDILLSKTYSETLNQDDVRFLYEGLYKNMGKG